MTITIPTTIYQPLYNARPTRNSTHAPGAAVDGPSPENELVEFPEDSASPHLQFLKLNITRARHCSKSFWQMYTTEHPARTGRCGRSIWQYHNQKGEHAMARPP